MEVEIANVLIINLVSYFSRLPSYYPSSMQGLTCLFEAKHYILIKKEIANWKGYELIWSGEPVGITSGSDFINVFIGMYLNCEI